MRQALKCLNINCKYCLPTTESEDDGKFTLNTVFACSQELLTFSLCPSEACYQSTLLSCDMLSAYKLIIICMDRLLFCMLTYN